MFTHILLIYSTSIALSSCAINRAKGHKMLEIRADYSQKVLSLNKNGAAVTPIQTPAKRSRVYVYPHQLPNGDYFLGGYIFAEIEKEKVIVNGGAE